MTTRNTFTAELVDIDRIELICDCGTSVSFDAGSRVRMPRKCGNADCDIEWTDQGYKTRDEAVIGEFLEVFRRAREEQNGKRRVKVRLVFDMDGSDEE